jgi:hypothetical protein
MFFCFMVAVSRQFPVIPLPMGYMPFPEAVGHQGVGVFRTLPAPRGSAGIPGLPAIGGSPNLGVAAAFLQH